MAREQVKRKKAAAVSRLGEGALIADGARVESDPWTRIADEDAIPPEGDIVVTFARFAAERDALLARNVGRLGVLIAPADKVEDIAEFASRLALIEVEFPVFRDGRGYTTARLLRERYHYRGELRAVGEVLEDQVFFMLRCGFDALEIIGRDPEAIFARAAKTFTNAYQAAADSEVPIYRRRAAPPRS